MIKELLISFKDNLESKSSNPFFGTLILIWLIKNWNLFYSIFNFDPKTTLAKKQLFILNHFKKHPFLETLGYCVLKSICLLIIAYFLINLSRLIVNFFEKKITPLVYKWTDNNSIVLRTVYENSENERKRLEKRLEEEREAKLKLQADYDKLEIKLAERLTKSVETQQDSSSKKDEVSSGDTKLDLILKKLKKENKIGAFELIGAAILNNRAINRDDTNVKEFASLGLITQSRYVSGSSYIFSLTSLGQNLHETILIEKLK
ncbi:hypothetical protein G4D82_14140 [Flavobacterium sp. CYK-4]|uniref:hypothetical protein n=1 Tax=Flavobacterium lotistagni TaxID=2709660 RepID=UPI001409AFD8|nr:hypothetical protein [Flavobacterium lotistagni]NHM08365.1 hypothetical protein [Flavobacterium lotistagni]